MQPGSPAVLVIKVPAAAARKATGKWYPPKPYRTPGCKIITRRKLCDTGCPYDLISPCDFRPIDLNHVEPGDEVTLHTANGSLAVNQVVPVQAPRLKSESRPYILQDPPDVLDIGHRFEMQGFAFFGHPSRRAPSCGHQIHKAANA